MRRTENDIRRMSVLPYPGGFKTNRRGSIFINFGIFTGSLLLLELQICGHNRNIILITQRGSEGQAKGLFSELEGIDIDSVCNVYVADIVIFVLSIQTIIAITQMPSNE